MFTRLRNDSVYTNVTTNVFFSQVVNYPRVNAWSGGIPFHMLRNVGHMNVRNLHVGSVYDTVVDTSSKFCGQRIAPSYHPQAVIIL